MMSIMTNLYLKGALVGAISGGTAGTFWSDSGRARNCLIGIAGGSAGTVALLAISALNPVAGLFCRYATYGGLCGALWGHKICQSDLIASIRVGVVLGLFIASMGLLFGAYGVYGALIGLSLASMAYFSERAARRNPGSSGPG